MVASDLPVLNESEKSAAARPTSRQVGAWLLLLIAATGLILFNYDSFMVGTNHDDAHYLSLAQSIVEGRPYGYAYTPGYETVSSHFPFGYPLLLSIGLRLTGGQFEPLRYTSLLFTLFSASLLFWYWPLFSTRSYWWALGPVAFFLFSPLTVTLSRQIMSEPMFVSAILLSLILAQKALHSGGAAMPLILLAVALMTAYLTRTVGVVLIAVGGLYILYQLRRRLWPTLALLTGSAVLFIALILALTSLAPADVLPTKYLEAIAAISRQIERELTGTDRPANRPRQSRKLNQPAGSPDALTITAQIDDLDEPGILDRLLSGPGRRIRGLRRLMLPIGGGLSENALATRIGLPFLPQMVDLFFLTPIIIGAVIWWRESNWPLSLYFVIPYFLATFPWVFVEDRLLYPIQPFVALSFIWGVQAIVAWAVNRPGRNQLVPRLSRLAVGAVTLPLLAIMFVYSVQLEDSKFHVGDLSLRTAWLKANTPADAVVMSELPAIDYLYGQRRMLPIPTWHFTRDQLDNFLHQSEAQYVLLGPQLIWIDPPPQRYMTGDTARLKRGLDRLLEIGRVQLVFADDEERLYIYEIVDD